MYTRRRFSNPFFAASVVWLLGACSEAPKVSETMPQAASARIVDPQVAHKDERSGLPTFIWLSPHGEPSPDKNAEAVAWQVLADLRSTYRMSAAAMQTVKLKTVHDLGRGAVLIRFEQELDGLPVFLRGVTVALNQNLRPIAASGNFTSAIRRTAPGFAVSAADAVSAALNDLGVANAPIGPTAAAEIPKRYTLTQPARKKQVMYPTPRGLVPAHYLELEVRADKERDSQLLSFVVSAIDSSILFRNNLTQDLAFTYRVWTDASNTPLINPYGNGFFPHPTGTPDGSKPSAVLPTSLVTLEHAGPPFSQNDPWLPPDATEGKGNNVFAYADIADPDGFDAGDVGLSASSPGVFDYTVDAEGDTTASATDRQAVITQLFYVLNHLHDTFYDAGFDEKSGNMQTNNFDRGGKGADAVLGEAQDFSGRNNANAKTPSDGGSPRIQMFLFDSAKQTTTVLSPPELAKVYDSGTAAFGPNNFNLTNQLVLVDDGAGTTTDGCTLPFVNAAALAGKFAVIDRGTCTFALKTKNAQDSGAVGVIIVSDRAGAPPNMSGTAGIDPSITIPTVSLTQSDGAALKTAINAMATVQLKMVRTTRVPDASLDASVLMHEWGHVLTNRLVGDANGLTLSQAKGMGEGWGDFVALLTLVRPEAAAVPANANWNGTFAVASFTEHNATDGYYYGLRRYPYSTDTTKNPLSYQHISSEVPLPDAPPHNGDVAPDNAEVHNMGEIWASMLWECYTNMLRDTGRYSFEQAQQRMREYLVASLKLTPIAPTLLEGRDALLAAMLARDSQDFSNCAASFAKRGAGTGAVAPDRFDEANSGATESSASGPDLVLVSYKLDDSASSCDADGIVDNEETGRLTVVVRNTGTSALSDATLTVTADDTALGFLNNGQAAFPVAQPFQSVTAKVDFRLKDANGTITPTLTFKVESSSLAVPRTISIDLKRTMNADVALQSLTTDSFDVPSPGWSTAGTSIIDGLAVPWQQIIEPTGEGRFAVPNHGLNSDQLLMSPPLQVDASGTFGFTLRHRYRFEKDSDGGVIEISQDDGQTWADIGETSFTANGYDSVLDHSSPNPLIDKSNPQDRKFFSNESASFPDFIESTVDLGTAFAGKTVRLRFRVGTDNNTPGKSGWELDELRLSGIINKPFPQLGPQAVACMNHPPTVSVALAEQSVAAGSTVKLEGSVSDQDGDAVTSEWVQTSGTPVTLDDATSLTPTFTAPSGDQLQEVEFALRASDGRAQAEATTKVTILPVPPTVDPNGNGNGNGNGNSDGTPPADAAGCGCRTTQPSGAARLFDLLIVALAGLYCRRKTRSAKNA